MTAYMIFKRKPDEENWKELGEIDANTPESAVKKHIRAEVAADNGQVQPASASYAACPQSAWTTTQPEVRVETQVRINVNSNRVIQSRKQQEAAEEQQPAAA